MPPRRRIIPNSPRDLSDNEIDMDRWDGVGCRRIEDWQMSATTQVEVIAKTDSKVLTVKPDDTVASAARTMTDRHVGCLLVADERERVVGILTERDIIANVVSKSQDPLHTHIADVMTRKVVGCTMATPIPRAQQVMAEHGIRHLPIMENGKPIGMISSRDILSHQLETVRAIARRQSKILNDLEGRHPGISKIDRDNSGRVII